MSSKMPFFTMAAAASLGHLLLSEADFSLSRQVVTVLAGDGADRDMPLGTVLGKRLFADPVIAAAGGNTGNGALGTLTLGDACKVGVYAVTCIAAAADGGRFQVVDPDGYRLADALVGVAWVSPQLAFTIADGTADFAVGDAFSVTVDDGDGKVVALAPAARDGTQLAYGALGRAVIAPDGVDVESFSFVRDVALKDAGMVWPAGIAADVKAAAISRLAAQRVFITPAV